MIDARIISFQQETFENAVAALLVAMAQFPVNIPKSKSKIVDDQKSKAKKSAKRSKPA